MKNLERKYLSNENSNIFKKQDLKEVIKQETYNNEKIEDRELSAEIMKKLKDVDLRYYVYAQCKNSYMCDTPSPEEEVNLVIPSHWIINGKKAEDIIGTKNAGVASAHHEEDLYYTIYPTDLKDLAGDKHEFTMEHVSLSGKTAIEFTVYNNPLDYSLPIIDVSAKKASKGTLRAIDEAFSMWKKDQESKEKE